MNWQRSIFPRHEIAPWCRIDLTKLQVQARHHERVRLAFNQVYMTARRRKGMSLWLADRDDGGVEIYLSPAVVAAKPSLVDRFGATRSQWPPNRSAWLLAGDAPGIENRRPQQLRLPVGTTVREHLPAVYRYRTVREAYGFPAPQRHTLAPFVRRYLDAWSPSRLTPAAFKKA